MVTFDALYVGSQLSDGTLRPHNNVGGVDVYCVIRNDTDKTIKYLTMVGVVPRNAVKDPVCCEVSGKSKTDLRITGPIGPHRKTDLYSFDAVWYNPTIRSLVLDNVKVVYTDGTSETIRLKYTPDKVLNKERRAGCVMLLWLILGIALFVWLISVLT